MFSVQGVSVTVLACLRPGGRCSEYAWFAWGLVWNSECNELIPIPSEDGPDYDDGCEKEDTAQYAAPHNDWQMACGAEQNSSSAKYCTSQ